MIFLIKIKKSDFFDLNRIFFDLNQTSRFKLNFHTNVSHLLGIINSSQDIMFIYYIKEVKN